MIATHPFIDHPMSWNDIQSFRNDQLNFLWHITQVHGKRVHFSMMGMDIYHLACADCIQPLLLEQVDKLHRETYTRKMFKRMMGEGILVAEDEAWKYQRKMMQPAFHAQRIGAYADTMVRFTGDMLDTWETDTIVPIHEAFSELTQRIIVQTMFNRDMHEFTAQFGEEMQTILSIGESQIGALPIPDWMPTLPRLKQQKARDKIVAWIDEIIADRMNNPQDHGDLLSMLLATRDEQGNTLTHQQIQDECMTLFIAGHETTAVTLTWAVAESQIAYDARDIAVSHYGEWKDKYVIAGGYWPPHFVISDAVTMEPLKVISTRGVNVDGEFVNEARVAAIYNTPNAPTWMVAVKELGQMWQVDYTDLDNLRIEQQDTHKFLHDGFFDPTSKYFQIAANASNRMEIVDTETRKAVASIETGKMPHPGPGANWIDPKCGPVSGTGHIGEGMITFWGSDPKGHPDQAWKICDKVETDGAGLFIRTHPNVDFVFMDQPKHPEPEVQQSIQIMDKKTRKIVKTIRVTEREKSLVLHGEFNKDGSELWVSVWARGGKADWLNGEIVVYDTKTLEEKARIKNLETPTGKFNVYNRVHHVT